MTLTGPRCGVPVTRLWCATSTLCLLTMSKRHYGMYDRSSRKLAFYKSKLKQGKRVPNISRNARIDNTSLLYTSGDDILYSTMPTGAVWWSGHAIIYLYRSVSVSPVLFTEAVADGVFIFLSRVHCEGRYCYTS
jgi:hypothetical protein